MAHKTWLRTNATDAHLFTIRRDHSGQYRSAKAACGVGPKTYEERRKIAHAKVCGEYPEGTNLCLACAKR